MRLIKLNSIAAFCAMLILPQWMHATECMHFSSKAVFNYWPLSYKNSDNCNDLPLIDALNPSAPLGVRSARYSGSQAEHDQGIEARIGDKVFISIYFNNGADPTNPEFKKNTMHEFAVTSTVKSTSASVYAVSARLIANDVATVSAESSHQGGPITISTGENTKLVYVPGSTQACVGHDAAVYYGSDMKQQCGVDGRGKSKILIPLKDGIVGGLLELGILPPGWPYSGTIGYELEVVSSTNKK